MNQNQVGASGGNVTFSRAVLGIGANTARINVAANVVFSIDGKLYSLTAVDNQAFSSGHTALGAKETCVFGVWVDSANVVTTNQGKIVSTDDVTNGKVAVPMPDKLADKALLGLVQVASLVGASFTPGTTALSASNVYDSYINCTVMPSKPLTTFPSS
jgi:hypothetical protein